MALVPPVPPSFSAARPQVVVEELAVEVHRHRRGCVLQDPLGDLRVGARAEPKRGAGVPPA